MIEMRWLAQALHPLTCVNHLVSLLHVFVNPAAAVASVPPGAFNSSCAASLALTMIMLVFLWLCL